jgi:Lrp/AsnC family transcriptional regulator for asnA, asnC and gidA
MDKLDHDIVKLLSTDARMSNRRIANELGFTEGTIRTRVKRLEQENLIRFTAVTSIDHLDKPRLAFIGIHAEQDKIAEVAEAVRAMPDITSVVILLGRFDVLAVGLFDGLDQVYKAASNRILALPGVRLIETSIVVDVIKYDSSVARIVKD